MKTRDEWLAVLDPAQLHVLIVSLLDREREGRRTIGIAAIASAILEQQGYAPGPERGRAYQVLSEALATLIPQIPGLRYV
ncbi:MAG: hypothetical protein JXA74_10970, partial [Anaerolineae bacterium]|nr:hypothetical protein [Anaerolineae bacterium]